MLVALVDADYKFIAVDIGSFGRNRDGNVSANFAIGKSSENKTQNSKKCSIGRKRRTSALCNPLKPYLLGPCSRRNLENNESSNIFNLERRLLENAFGILAENV